MAKQIKPQVEDVLIIDHRRDYFINSQGIKVHCLPVKASYIGKIREMITREYKKRGEPIEVPIYEYSVFGGGKKSEPYNQTLINDIIGKAETDEQKAEIQPILDAWGAHRDAQARLGAEILTKTMAVLVRQGIANEPPPEWIEALQQLGLDVSDTEQLKVDYREAELIVTESDITELMVMPLVLARTDLTPEEQAEIEASFRGNLEAFTRRSRNTVTEPPAG